MNIGLIAHDSKKKLMQNFCIAYKGILNKNQLFATGITSGLIAVIIIMKNISCSWKPAERIVTFMKV